MTVTGQDVIKLLQSETFTRFGSSMCKWSLGARSRLAVKANSAELLRALTAARVADRNKPSRQKLILKV